jgi:hypothetical protein
MVNPVFSPVNKMFKKCYKTLPILDLWLKKTLPGSNPRVRLYGVLIQGGAGAAKAAGKEAREISNKFKR